MQIATVIVPDSITITIAIVPAFDIAGSRAFNA
jgi:hypothetical protein